MLLAIIAVLVLVFDQGSKMLIRYFIPVDTSIPLVSGILHITHVRNAGAAFSLFPNQRLVFLIVSIAAIISIVYYYWRVGDVDRKLTIALGLMLGGAAGNLTDRLVSGRVTDFIDFRVWPIFNIADSAIDIGVALFIITMLIDARKESAQAKNPERTPQS
ncbi:MAG: signal peptidase II [Candidatus Aquicultor sp.]